MNKLLKKLIDEKKISPPSWLAEGTQRLVIMGSNAYGVSNDNSDMDLYGFCIPPKATVFPHLSGQIQGFGRQIKKFDQYTQSHIKPDNSDQTIDITIYNIIKYFQLTMECNPNMIDSLFVSERCVLHSTKIGDMVRDNRKLFLHKGAWHKFKGYAFSSLHKAKSKNPIGKRKETVEKYGWDVKFGYHVVRLISQIEQILTEGDLDLEEKGRREMMKAIRRGDWKLEQVEEWFYEREKTLGNLYHSSALPYSPDENAIKQLLIDCLEEYYGDLSSVIVRPDVSTQAVKDIWDILNKNKLTLGLA